MGAKLDILCMAPPFLIGILYIGGCVIIVPLLLLCVFRMILNKGWEWIVWNLFTIFVWPSHINFLSL